MNLKYLFILLLFLVIFSFLSFRIFYRIKFLILLNQLWVFILNFFFINLMFFEEGILMWKLLFIISDLLFLFFFKKWIRLFEFSFVDFTRSLFKTRISTYSLFRFENRLLFYPLSFISKIYFLRSLSTACDLYFFILFLIENIALYFILF